MSAKLNEMWAALEAHKHDAKPSDEAIIAAVERAVIDEICEWFRFDQEDNKT